MERQHSDMVAKRKYKRYSKQKMTYLGLIANLIQNAPEKRLTFCELMNSIGTVVQGDRKGLENNVRVCLSLNDCFVKVPINPESPNVRRNFWKVDDSKITPKMLRRHFSGVRDTCPDTYGTPETSSTKNATATKVYVANRTGTVPEKKFTSSFSIESILQRESSAPTGPAFFQRNFTNVCPGRTPNADNGLSCKRKTWDYPDQMEYDSFRTSYSHFSFPSYLLDQRCSPQINLPSKRLCTASELSYNYTASDNTRQFTSNPVTWAYI